jgi:hypothetical protein
MNKPDRTPNIIGSAEAIFRRYGQDVPSIKAVNSTHSILRDLNLDISMNQVAKEFDEGLKKLMTSGGGLEDFMKQMRWMCNQYKNIGEEVLRLETLLFQKIDVLDKLNNRIPVITSLTPNEALPELIESFTKYADNVFKSAKFEEDYKELVETYKRWNICRQIMIFQNTIKTDTYEAQCSICLMEPITSAIVPCGHTFCSNCIKKQNTNCYICRGIIRERIKLYFT